MATEHRALITWSPEQVQRGLPAISRTIDPAWFSDDQIGKDEAWSLACTFEGLLNEQGSPTTARVCFWMDHAPHDRLRPGTTLRMYERDTGKLAVVEILD